MSGLVGSAPKVQTSTQSTIDPVQASLLQSLLPNLTQGINNPLSFGQYQPTDTGQYAAPLSDLQSKSLAGIENIVGGAAPGGGTLQSSQPYVNATLNNALGSIGNAERNPISMIDPTQAFKQGVVQPLTDDFTQRVIPAISGQYGQSAGGAFSSDQQQSRQQSGTNLARTLAQQGSLFTLGADQANQAAQAQNAQLGLSAASILPAILGTPLALDAQQLGIDQAGLAAGAVPQETQQTQLSGEFSGYQSVLGEIQNYLADALGLGTARTQETQSVVNPGQTGLIPALLAAAAGGASRSFFAPGGYFGPGLG